MLSGNELVSLPLEELSDVKELKSRLSRIPGLPSRFRQRLSRCGSLLDDSAILDSPLDLELVLLPHSAASQTQADELVDASANGFASEVESMLQTPLHPDAVDVHGRSALVAASGQGHVQAVGLLLEANADKDRTNALGDTGLTVASVRGHVEVVRLLLEARADKDAIKGNWNPLMYASHQGHTEIVRLLLEAGADKDWAGNEAGTTALIGASGTGHVEVVRLLLEAGADHNVTCKKNGTALIHAARTGHTEIVRMLLSAGAGPIDTACWVMAMSRRCVCCCWPVLTRTQRTMLVATL